ncbi:hypothetical protein GGF46_001705 [Coemansia sp. RSA 552]|nr:hypothetical protein GGF46_001705 [Coemansia sp. RSA 552]
MTKLSPGAPSKKRTTVALLVGCMAALAFASVYLMFVVFDYEISQWGARRMSADSETCAHACRETKIDKLAVGALAESSEPVAYIVGSSQVLKEITPGHCVCVRAAVPVADLPVNTSAYQPIPGWPSDSLMIDLVLQSSKYDDGDEDPLYANSRVTVSVNMQPAFKPQQNARVRVYEGTAQLFDPGVYEVDARIEQRNGQWNAEPGDETPPYTETLMKTTLPLGSSESQVRVLRDVKHPSYLRRHQNLPLCKSGSAAGRWIPEANLPRSWKAWQYMFPAEDGRVWLPYSCRLRRISHAEFVFHMSRSHSSVHWYGDSNSRRTLRPFMMGGKWCHQANTTTRLDCLCNDAPKDLFPSEWYPNMPVPHWYRIHNLGVDSDEVYADLRQRPLMPTDPRPIMDKDPSDTGFGPGFVPPGYGLRKDYFDLYYLFTRGTLDMYGSYWERDITRHQVSQYRPADLVVVQLITWDVCFGKYSQFTSQVNRLVKRLRHVYPKAEFVYRTGPYWCCRSPEDQTKKYSRLRFVAFDAYARNAFQKGLGARVWDVSGPQSQRPPESKRRPENMPCRSAHSRSEHIHLDNQLFMNMIVNSL